MKKFFAFCLSVALLLPSSSVVFAASSVKRFIKVNATATEASWNGNTLDGYAGEQIEVKYETIAVAMEDLEDGTLTDSDNISYKLDRSKSCNIYITGRALDNAYEETISKKVIISTDSTKTAASPESEITLNFKEVLIAVKSSPKKNNTITFSGGLEVKDGAKLVLDNNTEDKVESKISYSFNAPVTVSGSLKFEGNQYQLGNNGGTSGSVNFTNGANLTVENGGEVTAASVAITGENASSPLLKVNEGGKLDFVTAGVNSYGTIQTSGTAIQVDGGEVKIDAGKITSTGGAAVVANNGTVTIEKGEEYDVTKPEISSTGNGQSAIKVENNATLVLPQSTDAKITTQNNDGKAVDLAAGSKVQQGENTITVASVEGESASNYVDNYGNIVLQSGGTSSDGNKEVAPNTIIQPNGTAITGNNKLPDVKDDGSVTIPEGGAIVTNPDGNKIEVDKDDKVPAIAIGVKNKDGKIETSMRVESGGPSLTIEAASFDSNVNFSDYTCSVQSDKTNVATATLSDKDNTKITVTPVGVGEATITATFTKKDANGASLLSGETLTATFKVTVYKNSSGGGGGGGSTQKLNKVYRAYNPNNGEHLYTLDEKEYKHVTSLGWHDEGVAFMAETEKNAKALYRVYNPNSGLHHYTLDENEKNTLVSLGWNEEGIAWYTSKDDKDAVVYRVYNPNDGNHHYTMNQQEKDVLVSLGWQFEGIAFKTAPIEK